MKILNQQLTPTAGSTELQANKIILITDSSALTQQANKEGIEVIQVSSIEMVTSNDWQEEMILALKGKEIIINALGFLQNAETVDFGAINLFSSAYFGLLKKLRMVSRHLTLISLSGAAPFLTALMDGMAQSLCKESDRLTYKSIALDATTSLPLMQLIGRCINQSGIRFAAKGTEVYRSEMSPSTTMEKDNSTALRERGTYLITGGNGGVGRLLCNYLVEKYKAKVYITGRRSMSDDLAAKLKKVGAEAYLKADVSNFETLQSAVQYIQSKEEKIDGLFHLAGALNDALFDNMTKEQLQKTLQPKVAGLMNIARIDAANSFGFVCNFTSVSGWIGNVGQAAYASANACIDAYTSYRNQNSKNGSRWLSINWGLWKSNDGMQMEEGGSMEAMAANEACQAMEAVFKNGWSHAAIYKGAASIMETTATVQVPASTKTISNTSIIDEMASWVKTVVYKFTRLKNFADDTSILELGVDSVNLINITVMIESELKAFDSKIRLSKAMIFDYPSVMSLSTLLYQKYPEASAALMNQINSKSANNRSEIPQIAKTESIASSNTTINFEGSTIDWLKQIVQKYSGIKRVSEEENLLELGIDSVASINISIEISRQLESAEGKRLPKAILFEYPTISRLANYLSKAYAAQLENLFGDRKDKTPSTIPSNPINKTIANTPKKPANNNQSDASINKDYRGEDVAIIGLAGEYPNANTPEELWEMLMEKECGVTEIPNTRWDWKKNYHTDKNEAGKSYGRHGGFVRKAKEFDPVFFNIAPIDAAKIDPQERRLLETTYHALEDAGFFSKKTPEVGVFVSTMFGHYQDLDHKEGALGGSLASVANRISYSFDFHGPCFTIDSMCSGSLTAIHLATNSIRLGESEVAIAGAVNIMPHPGKYKLLSEGRFLSPTGRCHSFGVAADGYVPGEGAVVVVLKKMADAIRDEDNILGVIRATAINSGGRSSSFTVPSARAQSEVIRKALDKADISPDAVDYVEAHGTGTALGDPIEIQGLQTVYGERANNNPILLGSVKSNIGHLESAAGLAGLSKLLLQYRFKKIAPTIGCTIENPHLNLEETPFVLAKEAVEWSSNEPRFSALSSFGAGGSNGHLILQEYLPVTQKRNIQQDQYLIPISAKNKRTLRKRLEDLQHFLQENPNCDMYALSYTLANCREHFSTRVCYQVSNQEGLENLLTLQLNRHADFETPIDGLNLTSEIALEYLNKQNVDFSSVFSVKSTMQLPNYPFECKEYWTSLEQERTAAVIPISAKAEKETTIKVVKSDNERVLLSPQWKTAPLVSAQAAAPKAMYLFWGDKIPSNVSVGNQPQLRLENGTQFQVDATTIRIQAGEEQSYNQLFAYLKKSYQVEQINFVYSPEAQADRERETFAMTKAMLNSGIDIRILHLVTENGAALNHALGGVFHTLALENKNICAKTLALSSDLWEASDQFSTLIIEEFSDQWKNYVWLKRDGVAREERSLKEEVLQSSDVRFRTSGVYVISGGMGMIGLAITEELIKVYNATVILLGRSSLDEQKQNRLNQINGESGKAIYRSVDITDEIQMKNCINNIVNTFGNINGIIHSAAVLYDGLMQNKNWANFKQVLDVKIVGAHHLDRASSHLKLDFFTMFSSISSVMGNVGQADYVTANRYLDQYAAERNRKVARNEAHGHSLSINWPLWMNDAVDPNENGAQGAAGSLADANALSNFLFKSFGTKPIGLQQGAQYFIDLINGVNASTNQVMALIGAADKIRQSFTDEGKVTHVKPIRQIPKTTANTKASFANVAQRMTNLVSEITMLAEEDIDGVASWGDMGFSSVMLQQLAAKIDSIFGLSVPASIFFTYNNLDAFIQYLEEEGCAIETTIIENSESENMESSTSSIREESVVSTPKQEGYAIIGMNGQMPGGKDLEDFWQLLVNRESAIQKVDRWSEGEYYAGTIDGIKEFDAKFFGLSAREAMLMDPQHRLFLQTCYNTFLDAGYSPRSTTSVGVFAGVQFNDYQTLLQQWQQSKHPYAATGNAHAMLANRVSYLLNLRGPSQTIDTACSSSLIALNRGIMSLEKGECDMALVGGVSLLIDPMISDAAASMGVLSPNYRCATFDASADGYVRAEGVGCVLVKRLDAAIRDRDSIYAIIAASSENHGGKANSLTAPNPDAQKELLLRAYNSSTARQVSYIETHGTGTKLGDPIEIDALKNAWKNLCPEKDAASIALGAVKTNIGHLEPAAGIASLLKVVLAFQHKQLPGNVHLASQNPYIDLAESPFKLLRNTEPWEVNGERVAGISSFGFGGSNAHVVLRESLPYRASSTEAKKNYLVTLSAKSMTSLEQMCRNLSNKLSQELSEEYSLANLSYTLNTGREHFDFRLAWIVEDIEQLQQVLNNINLSEVRKVKSIQKASDLGILDANRSDYAEQLETWRTAYRSGELLDWDRLYQNESCQRIHLPTYHFDTREYWFESAKDSELMKIV